MRQKRLDDIEAQGVDAIDCAPPTTLTVVKRPATYEARQFYRTEGDGRSMLPGMQTVALGDAIVYRIQLDGQHYYLKLGEWVLYDKGQPIRVLSTAELEREFQQIG